MSNSSSEFATSLVVPIAPHATNMRSASNRRICPVAISLVMTAARSASAMSLRAMKPLLKVTRPARLSASNVWAAE